LIQAEWTRTKLGELRETIRCDGRMGFTPVVEAKIGDNDALEIWVQTVAMRGSSCRVHGEGRGRVSNDLAPADKPSSGIGIGD
jgi:hypothetical protein